MSLATLLGAPKGPRVPPGDVPPKPAPDKPPARARAARGGAQARYFAEVLTQLQQLTSTMTDLAAAFSGRQPVNKVMQVRTITIPASGVFGLDFHSAIGAVTVANLAAATATPTPTSQAPANPAAGADLTITVPAGQTWALQTLEFTLTTNATVANRQIILVIDDGNPAHELWRIIVPVTQAASLAYVYAFGGTTNDAAVRTVGANNEVLSELPAITLGAGYRIRTLTQNLQAGDQFSAIAVGEVQTSTTGHTVTVTSNPPSDSAPTAGVGVAVIPAGSSHTINLASHAVTVYGTAGDQVLLQAFTAGAPPSAG